MFFILGSNNYKLHSQLSSKIAKIGYFPCNIINTIIELASGRMFIQQFGLFNFVFRYIIKMQIHEYFFIPFHPQPKHNKYCPCAAGLRCERRLEDNLTNHNQYICAPIHPPEKEKKVVEHVG